MEQELKEQAEQEAILDLYTYLDVQSDDYKGKNLAHIMNDLKGTDVADTPTYKTIRQAIITNPSIGQMQVVSQSSIDGGIDMKELNAVTFQNPSTGDIIVSYRGTGDGKWVDNGVGLSSEQSLMQKRANEYYDYVVENYVLVNGGKKGILDISGHSKGGNEAMVVTMESKYSYLIDHCYNFDGQGVSNQAFEKYENLPNYDEQRDKIILICGENDYVHDLGNMIVKDENIYFIQTPDADNIGAYHDLNYLFGADGTLNEEATYGQGPIGKLAKMLSVRLMALEEDDIEDSAITLMSILERVMVYDDRIGGKYLYGTGDVAGYTPEECIGFLANGLPLLISTMVATKEGQDVLKDIFIKVYMSIDQKYGFVGVYVAVWLTIVVVILSVWIIGNIVIRAKLIDFIFEAVAKVRQWSTEISREFQQLKRYVMDLVDAIDNQMSVCLNAGGTVCSAQIVIDTNRMQTYADAISQINHRLRQLDQDMDELYEHIGLIDIWNLLQADLLTSGSYKLKRIENYLRETAADFNSIEQQLILL